VVEAVEIVVVARVEVPVTTNWLEVERFVVEAFVVKVEPKVAFVAEKLEVEALPVILALVKVSPVPLILVVEAFVI
jgi:hypothetical protein